MEESEAVIIPRPASSLPRAPARALTRTPGPASAAGSAPPCPCPRCSARSRPRGLSARGRWETLWKGWGERGPPARLHLTSSPRLPGGDPPERSASAQARAAATRAIACPEKEGRGGPVTVRKQRQGHLPGALPRCPVPGSACPKSVNTSLGRRELGAVSTVGGAWGRRQESVAGKRRVSFPGGGKELKECELKLLCQGLPSPARPQEPS